MRRERQSGFAALSLLGFYEAEFVKTRCENCFLFIFGSFGRPLATTYLVGFGA